ncbi:hypothetical protein BH11PSE9_BH11PSE9_20940 [soil metagenome]
MQTPTPQNLPSDQPQRMVRTKDEAWQALLREMTVLHAQVEYLRLILKMGVRKPFR